jgi:RNA polymerase sigma factor (sigma-70 family)
MLNAIVDGLRKNEHRDRDRRPRPAGSREDLAELVELGLATYQALPIRLASFSDDFDRAVRGLDGPERDAFILTDLRGLTVREAADVLDVSFKTVARRTDSARADIREELIAA